MNSALAIAAATATLRNLLDRLKTPLTGLTITTKPPAKARKTTDTNSQLNLFLYHVAENAAWRNRDLPVGAHPIAAGTPPLALDLYYMLTAYGKGDEDDDAHKVLGHAMRMLYDHPVLDPGDLRDAVAGAAPFEQVEHLRIRHHDLSLDDKVKLWSAFQSDYRVTVAYQVSVALIRSDRTSPPALPVLQPAVLTASPTTIPPSPRTPPTIPHIEDVEISSSQGVAQLGDVLTLRGQALAGAAVLARFQNGLLTTPIELSAEPGGTAERVQFKLPVTATASNQWVAGLHQLSVRVTDSAGATQTSEPWPLLLAPTVTGISPNPAPYGGADTVAASVTVKPKLRPQQRVSLLIAGRAVRAQALSSASASAVFQIKEVPVGPYYVRLRVDGVDSPIVDLAADPPVFFASRRLELQP